VCVCFQRVADSRETLGDGMVLYCTEVHSLSDFQHMLSGLDETVRAHVSAQNVIFNVWNCSA